MVNTSLAARAAVTPNVTVLMPVLNAMPYLPAAVDSILHQTHSNLTLVTLDDGSTDGSVEFLQSHPDGRVKFVGDGRHHGMGALLNHGITLAEHCLVARMDADDLCPPERLARQVAAFDQDSDLVAVGTQFQYIGQTAERRGFGRLLPLGHDRIVKDLRSGTLCVIHASMMMRTKALREIGGYRFGGIGEDWDMFLRLAEWGRFANLPTLGYLYRLHGNNVTTLNQRFTQRRIRFACACAEARLRGVAEPAEAEWIAGLAARPWSSRCREVADNFSLGHYYTGRSLVLNEQPIRGYAHLAIGMLTSPRRAASRVADLVQRAAAKMHSGRPIGASG